MRANRNVKVMTLKTFHFLLNCIAEGYTSKFPKNSSFYILGKLAKRSDRGIKAGIKQTVKKNQNERDGRNGIKSFDMMTAAQKKCELAGLRR